MQVRLLPPPLASRADDPGAPPHATAKPVDQRAQVRPPPLALKPAQKAAARPPSPPVREPTPAALRKGPAAPLPLDPPPDRPPEPASAPSGHAIEAPPPPPLASAPPAAADTGVARDSRQSGDPGATDDTGPVSSAPALALTPASFDAAYLNNPPPQYPRASRRRGEEGRVVLRVRVLSNGSADAVKIAESSGYPRLDDAARDTVRAWRFVPAGQGEVKVESWLKVPIVFRLEG